MKLRHLLCVGALGLGGSLLALDLNQNGMSDVWERKYDVAAGSAAEHLDGDRFSNLEESLWGTDPRDLLSRPSLKVMRDPALPDEVRLRIDTQIGKRYEVLTSNDLVTWSAVGPVIEGEGPFAEVVTTLANSYIARAFFRYRLAADIDADGDGLTAWEENELGTSDTSADTDGDGSSDAAEFQSGTAPTDYYNGASPTLSVWSGNNQAGDPDTFAAEPLRVAVANAAGQPLVNAPVEFLITSGGAGLSAAPAPQPNTFSSVMVRTDSAGIASVYLLLPYYVNETATVSCRAVTPASVPGATFTALTNDLPPPEAVSDVAAIMNAEGTTTVTWQDNSSNETEFIVEQQDYEGTWEEVGWAEANQSAVTVPAQQQNYRVRADNHGARSLPVESNPVVTRYAVIDLQGNLGAGYLDPLYLTNSGYVLLRDGHYNYRWHDGQTEDMGESNRYMDMLENGQLVAEPEEDPISNWKTRNGVTVGGGSILSGEGNGMNVINGEQKPFVVYDINSQGAVLAYQEIPVPYRMNQHRFFFYDHLNGQTEREFITYPSFSSEPWPYTLNHRVVTVVDAQGNASNKVSPQVVGANYNREKAVIWEEDVRTGKYNFRYLNHAIDPNSGWDIQYAEGINDAGVIAAVGKYQPKDANGNPIGSPTQKACLLVPVEIKEVISDQISGNEANKLPTAYYRLQANNPMLMATRSGNDARLAIKMDVPTAVASSVRVGVRQRGETAVINSVASVPPPGKTLLSFTAVDGSKTYEVVAGYDANSNSVLDPSEVSVVFQKTPKTNENGAPYVPLPGIAGDPTFQYLDRIIVVTQNDYTAARATTEGYGTGATISTFYPTAAKFIQAFGSGANTIDGASPTEFGVLLDASVIPSADGLSHPLGVRWDAANQANTHRLVLPSNSPLGGKIPASEGLLQMYERVLRSKKDALAATATSNWSMTSISVDDRDIDFAVSDNTSELHVALGKCRFVGTLEVSYRALPAGGIEVNSLNCYGSMIDLYDFAYGAKKIFIGLVEVADPKNAARTQAGNATLATAPWPDAGRVFFTKVEFGTGWFAFNGTYQ